MSKKAVPNPDFNKSKKSSNYVGTLKGGYVAERHDIFAEARGAYVGKSKKGKGSYKRKEKYTQKYGDDSGSFFLHNFKEKNKCNKLISLYW